MNATDYYTNEHRQLLDRTGAWGTARLTLDTFGLGGFTLYGTLNARSAKSALMEAGALEVEEAPLRTRLGSGVRAYMVRWKDGWRYAHVSGDYLYAVLYDPPHECETAAEADALDTLAFLRSQVRSAAASLSAAEDNLTRFAAEHAALLAGEVSR